MKKRGNETRTSSFNALMGCLVLDGLDNATALERLGELIDLSNELERPDGTERALTFCEELGKRELAQSDHILLHYFWANALDHIRLMKHREAISAWSWEQPELLQQIFHLRCAVASNGFSGTELVRRCQIYTNLANNMNTAGRLIEAIEYWGQALELSPNFGMALANRANGFSWYARLLYDKGHSAVFLKFAHDSYTSALSSEAIYENSGYADAKKFFKSEKRQIECVLNLQKASEWPDFDSYNLGRSKAERQYRRWCLDQTLFLNPLNDLSSHSIAARDVLALPAFITPVGDTPALPALPALYSQMKQEFVSARFLAYEGIKASRPHYSDRDVLLYDTLDYPAYSLAVEKTKAAYRISYSLLDKVAYFINAYWDLSIPPRDVSLRRVWYVGGERKKGLWQKFTENQNLPLRGLYWLSNDLFDGRPGFKDSTQPEAQALSEIRNCLEHRCLRVHWEGLATSRNQSDDDLINSIGRDSFEAKTIRLLKMARAALIYLSLAMHREERLRAKNISSDTFVPMYLQVWPDDWKR